MAEITTLSFTGTNVSISVVSRITGTREGSWSVSAAGISATTSVVCCTFVDICITKNQMKQLLPVYRIALKINSLCNFPGLSPPHCVIIPMVKVNWLHIAPRCEHTSKVLERVWHAFSKDITVYLHTPRSSASHTCLCFSFYQNLSVRLGLPFPVQLITIFFT